MAGRASFAVAAMLLVASARAEVYRCETAGQRTYTDRPCSAQAQPQDLPAPIVVPRDPAERARAREYDRRIERERRARDQADAEWARAHAARKEHEAAIRHARIAGKPVKGMDADDVRGVWGEPQEVSREERDGVPWERWTYRNGGETRTVQFRDGAVHSTRSQGARKRK